ncbi:hypothetical protein PTI98_001621 [Pleurotus ostreatus]|nr:hypothetical protein PTI98_001621 [Pleurotus ostreatus]
MVGLEDPSQSDRSPLNLAPALQPSVLPGIKQNQKSEIRTGLYILFYSLRVAYTVYVYSDSKSNSPGNKSTPDAHKRIGHPRINININ